MLLSVPLIFELVPRNSFYGFRTAKTRSSNSIWYAANKIAGVWLAVSGMLGLIAAVVLSRADVSERSISLTTVGLVLAAVLVAALKVRKL
jgi:hypothetical protein